MSRVTLDSDVATVRDVEDAVRDAVEGFRDRFEDVIADLAADVKELAYIVGTWDDLREAVTALRERLDEMGDD